MKRPLIAAAACFTLCGCGPHIAAALGGAMAQSAAANVVEPASVETGCKVVTWGASLPKVQGYFSRLTTTEQSIVADAEQAARFCAIGNAPAAIGSVAKALVEVLYTKHT